MCTTNKKLVAKSSFQPNKNVSMSLKNKHFLTGVQLERQNLSFLDIVSHRNPLMMIWSTENQQLPMY